MNKGCYFSDASCLKWLAWLVFGDLAVWTVPFQLSNHVTNPTFRSPDQICKITIMPTLRWIILWGSSCGRGVPVTRWLTSKSDFLFSWSCQWGLASPSSDELLSTTSCPPTVCIRYSLLSISTDILLSGDLLLCILSKTFLRWMTYMDSIGLVSLYSSNASPVMIGGVLLLLVIHMELFAVLIN